MYQEKISLPRFEAGICNTPDTLPFLFFDVDGSHVAGSIYNNDSNVPGPVFRAGYTADLSGDLFRDIVHMIGLGASRNTAGVAGAQLAMPSPFEFDSGISRMTHKLQSLFGIDLKGKMSDCLGWQPTQVRFLSDAFELKVSQMCDRAALTGAAAAWLLDVSLPGDIHAASLNGAGRLT